ncbi:MAG: N-acetylneuraminate synthase family protein [Pseudomonadota bacterium]
MNAPELIFETASFHGGDAEALFAIVAALKEIDYPGEVGVKFHPISADELATPDFFAHPIYQRLEISSADWAEIIASAAPLHVWLEMADAECARRLIANRAAVRGVKFQSSMIDNAEVLEALADAAPEGLQALVNVSGLSLEEIERCLVRFADAGLRDENMILQVGFQGYPTAVEDTMLNKIGVLQSAFPDHRLSLADHVDATDGFARVLPAVAAGMGAAFIEKHVCLNRAEAPFDAYSALEPAEAAEMADHVAKAARAFAPRFIAPAERRYLEGSILQPALRAPAAGGTLVAPDDVVFRRQGAPVLSLDEIAAEQARGRVLSADASAGRGVTRAFYRDAVVGAVVACRLKSTRLKMKPKLLIDGVPALDRCLENCLRFGVATGGLSGGVVLATSTLEADDALGEHTLDGRVFFRRGDPEDVMRRYLDVADELALDVIIRVTADNPVVSPEIADLLLERHFASGADFTRAAKDAVGTGMHVINVEAMRRVMASLGAAPLSEYMNWYFENNADAFKVNVVDLPEDLVRDYRLTLDYEADLKMFDALFAELRARDLPPLTRNVFSVLDDRPDIAAMNSDQVIVYATDQALIDQLTRETKMAG